MATTNFIGNEKTINRLSNLAKSRRIAHAYLFSGPEGVGKKRAAIEFGRTLLCEK
ncbi:MAG: DNA polymerase III subunit delta', partial [Planctomycetota bacterium]|nr:DNA polymerase III subunit delta' [Planctomycetota bacterium]